MLAHISLGGEIDIASGKELDDSTDRVLDAINGRSTPRPTYTRVIKACTIIPPATQLVTVGGPPIGRIWNVLAYAVCGQDDTTEATGNVSFFIGSAPTSGRPNLADLIIPSIPVHSSASFGDKVYWCHSNEAIYASLNALGVVTQFTAIFHVAEWREQDILEHSGR